MAKRGNEVNVTSNISVALDFFDVIGSFNCHIRLSQGFLYYNLSFLEMFRLGTFLLWIDLRTVAIEGNPHFDFFGQAWFFDVVVYFAYNIRLPQGFLH